VLLRCRKENEMSYCEPYPGYITGKTKAWAYELKNYPYGLPKFNARDAKNIYIPVFKPQKKER
jgi:hypothetical protein